MQGTPPVGSGRTSPVEGASNAEQRQVAPKLTGDQVAVVEGTSNPATNFGNLKINVTFGTIRTHDTHEQAYTATKNEEKSFAFVVHFSSKSVSVHAPVLEDKVVIITLKDDPEGTGTPDPAASKVNISIMDRRTEEITSKKDGVERSLLESMGLNLDRSQLALVHGQCLTPQLGQYLLDAVH